MSTDVSNYAASISTSGLQSGTATAITALVTAIQAAPAPVVMPLLQLVGQLSSTLTAHGL